MTETLSHGDSSESTIFKEELSNSYQHDNLCVLVLRTKLSSLSIGRVKMGESQPAALAK